MSRLQALYGRRSSWQSTWRDMASYIQPRRQRFFTSDAQSAGVKKEQQIINGTPQWSLRTLAAGMMAGITSPARPWFRLQTQDKDLNDTPDVKQWLHDVEARMLDAMSRSNFYDTLQTEYVDLGLFGTGCATLEEDDKTYFRGYVVPMGEFFLAQSERGEVDTLYHETTRTVSQLVERFGRDACSQQVRDAFDKVNFDELIEVVHVIEPRREYNPERLDAKNMPWASIWFEKGAGADKNFGILSESGYRENPILAPRWSVVGNDTYGSSPGFEALGDAKALQQYEKDKARAIEIIVDPPMNVPSSDRNRNVSLLPGARNYTASPDSEGAKPAMTVPPGAVEVLDRSISQHEQRIKTAFYADLFLMLSQDQEGSPITAREVQERHEEKLLQLGPVMERLENELLTPAVERVFAILYRKGVFPPAPQSVKGKQLQVEYLSIMAQAQKAIAVSGIQQLTASAMNIAAVRPDIMDNIDLDQLIEDMADALGVNPALVVPKVKVALLRAQRQKQQQMQMQAQQALAASQSAKNLAGASTSGNNALTQMLGPEASAEGGLQ